MKTIFLILTSLSALHFAFAQNTWTVNAAFDSGSTNFSQPQAAIDAAQPGDIIRVYPGQYENATIDKSISLIGSGYNVQQNIPNSNTLTQTTFSVSINPNVNDVLIQGIDLGNVFLSSNENIIIRSNRVDYIRINNSSQVVFHGNYLNSFGLSNTTGASGAALLLIGTLSNIQITNNIFSYNRYSNLVRSNHNSIFYSNPVSGNVTISNNVFRDEVILTSSLNSIYTNNIHLATNPNEPMCQNCSFVSNNLSVQSTNSNNLGDIQPVAIFVGYGNNPNNYSFDEQYKLKPGSPAIGYGLDGVDCGAFGGNIPYVLSGLIDFPFIYQLNVPLDGSTGSGIDIEIKVKAGQ